MTVKAFRLTNFMAFGEWPNESDGWIELRPITLLFGRNSSGKSSVLRALRFLRQSLEGGPNGSPFVYADRNGVDVGRFLSIVHLEPSLSSHPDSYVYSVQDVSWTDGSKRLVRFDFRLELPNTNLSHVLPGLQFTDGTTEVTVSLGYGWLREAERAGLMSASIYLAEEGRSLFDVERLKPETADLASSSWYFGSGYLSVLDETEQSLWPQLSPEPVEGGFLPTIYIEQDLRKYANEDVGFVNHLLDAIRQTVVDFLKPVESIRPVRPEPERLFLLRDSEQARWRLQGREAYLRLLRDELSPDQMKTLNQWLLTLDLGDEVRVNPLIKTDGGLATEIAIVEHDIEVNLIDVGYGAGQVLPVILQAILAKEGSLTLIEQPELHLHPRAQAQLADVFVQNCGPKAKFLIETHSEHFLLRIRRWLAETTADKTTLLEALKQNNLFIEKESVTKEDVGVWFIHRAKKTGKSIVAEIELNEFGDFLNKPEGFEGFFADDRIEIVEIARAKLG